RRPGRCWHRSARCGRACGSRGSCRGRRAWRPARGSSGDRRRAGASRARARPAARRAPRDASARPAPFANPCRAGPLLLFAAAVVAPLGKSLAQELDELLLLFPRQDIEPAPDFAAVVTIGVLGHGTPPQGLAIIRETRDGLGPVFGMEAGLQPALWSARA